MKVNPQSPSWIRPTVAGILGAAVTVVVAIIGAWQLALLTGWLTMASVFLLLTWLAVHHLDADQTRAMAAREDGSRAITDITLIVASIVSLGAVGLVIVDAGQSGSASSLAQVFLSVLSVIASWTVIHTLFTLRYARLYFLDGTEGGIDFGSDDRPRYSDFAYVAFTLGMTYQVSDTTLRSARLRATALRHALLSYLFGAVIIAVTINLVAGLMR